MSLFFFEKSGIFDSKSWWPSFRFKKGESKKGFVKRLVDCRLSLFTSITIKTAVQNLWTLKWKSILKLRIVFEWSRPTNRKHYLCRCLSSTRKLSLMYFFPLSLMHCVLCPFKFDVTGDWKLTPIYPSIRLSLYPSIHLSLYPSLRLSISLFVYPSNSVSVYPSIWCIVPLTLVFLSRLIFFRLFWPFAMKHLGTKVCASKWMK